MGKAVSSTGCGTPFLWISEFANVYGCGDGESREKTHSVEVTSPTLPLKLKILKIVVFAETFLLINGQEAIRERRDNRPPSKERKKEISKNNFDFSNPLGIRWNEENVKYNS